jgi:ribose-phosphate pyrophosphokinase
MPILVSGTSNGQLAEKVGGLLGMPLHPVDIRRFSDGEVYVELEESVRGDDVFLLQSTSPGIQDSVNDHLMELILLVSACRRASAQTITAVIPYYGYARSDRLSKKRTTIAAADVAKILVSMGVDRVVCVELHAGQIEGFFGGEVAVDDLDATSTFVNYLPTLLGPKYTSGIVVVSPDAGGVARAKRFRNKCETAFRNKANNWSPTGLAIIVKHRIKPNEVASMELVGQVQGKVCVLVDDMCDTAGTLLRAAQMLMDAGATSVYACIAHGILSGPACDRLKKNKGTLKVYDVL